MATSTLSRLEITFQLNIRDVYKANISIAIDNLTRFRAIIRLIVIVVIASIAFGFASGPADFRSSILRGGFWSILFFPILLLSTCYVSTYFAARSVCKNNLNIQNSIHYLFSDDLVIQEMATGRSELRWVTFIRVKETKDQFLLFVRKYLAHPVPKRAFASEQEIAAFRELIRNHLQDCSLR